ncbi:hypothetical protein Trydic_g19393 [Trypoxylus dichotomus]
MFRSGGGGTSSKLVLLVLTILLGKSLNAFSITLENATSASGKHLNKFFYNLTSLSDDRDEPEDCIYNDKKIAELNANQLIMRLTEECRYDRLTNPRPSNGGPLVVRIHLDIKHIDLLDNELYKIDAVVKYRYTDHRLKFEHVSPKRGKVKGRDLIQKRIWIPEIAVLNKVDAKVMGLEGKDVFASISPQGEVVYAFRSLITPYCDMDFRKFPFDRQNCTLDFQSLISNKDELLVLWDKEAVKLPEHITGFQLLNFNTSNDPLRTLNTIDDNLDGHHSTVRFNFRVAREVGHYLLDYFIPSILLVGTSWITFWLQADASPPRTTLGTSTMLTFITLATAQTKSLPKVSYIKISEIWFLGCVMFILASLVEFAFVNLIFRRKKNCELKKVNSKYVFKCTLTPSLARNELYNNMGLLNGDNPAIESMATKGTNCDEPILRGSHHNIVEGEPEMNNYRVTWTTMTPKEVANWIDTRCRVVFPLAFLIFNLFFWSYTLSVSYN